MTPQHVTRVVHPRAPRRVPWAALPKRFKSQFIQISSYYYIGNFHEFVFFDFDLEPIAHLRVTQ